MEHSPDVTDHRHTAAEEDPESVLLAAGISTSQLAIWRYDGVDLFGAAAVVRAGGSLLKVEALTAAGVDLFEAASLLREGCTADEVIAWQEAGVSLLYASEAFASGVPRELVAKWRTADLATIRELMRLGVDVIELDGWVEMGLPLEVIVGLITKKPEHEAEVSEDS